MIQLEPSDTDILEIIKFVYKVFRQQLEEKQIITLEESLVSFNLVSTHNFGAVVDIKLEQNPTLITGQAVLTSPSSDIAGYVYPLVLGLLLSLALYIFHKRKKIQG